MLLGRAQVSGLGHVKAVAMEEAHFTVTAADKRVGVSVYLRGPESLGRKSDAILPSTLLKPDNNESCTSSSASHSYTWCPTAPGTYTIEIDDGATNPTPSGAAGASSGDSGSAAAPLSFAVVVKRDLAADSAVQHLDAALKSSNRVPVSWCLGDIVQLLETALASFADIVAPKRASSQLQLQQQDRAAARHRQRVQRTLVDQATMYNLLGLIKAVGATKVRQGGVHTMLLDAAPSCSSMTSFLPSVFPSVSLLLHSSPLLPHPSPLPHHTVVLSF